MSLARRCQAYIDRLTQSRGAIYASGNSVRLAQFDGESVIATVEGSRRQPYDVMIDWSEAASGTVFVSCTCPHFEEGNTCKHVWATLLTIDKKYPDLVIAGPTSLQVEHDLAEDDVDDDDRWDWYGDEDDEDDAEDEGNDRDAILALERMNEIVRGTTQRMGGHPSGSDQNAGRVQSEWDRSLAALYRRNTDDSPNAPWQEFGRIARRAWYALEVDTDRPEQSFRVRLYQQERLKSGEFGRCKRLTYSPQMTRDFDDPRDRQLLPQLFVCAQNNPTWDRYRSPYQYSFASSARPQSMSEVYLPPSFYGVLLPGLVATGRFICDPETIELESASADSLAALASLSLDTERWRYDIVITADDAKKQWTLTFRLVQGEQVLVLDQVRALDHHNLFLYAHRLAFFDTDVPDAWIRWLNRHASMVVPYHDRDYFLARLWQKPDLPSLVWPANLALTPIAEPPQPLLRVREDRQRSYRDYLAAEVRFDYGERIVGPDAMESGFPRADDDGGPLTQVRLRDREAERQRIAELNQLPSIGRDQYDPNPGSLHLKKKHLPGIVELLLPRGWKVEAEGRLFRTAGDVHIEVQSGIDWFDVHASIDFDGMQVQLPDLLRAVRRGDRYVELGDGSRGMLPLQWLKRYSDMADLGEATEGKIRFARSQALLLDALLAEQEHLQVDPDYAEYRERLRNVHGVAPLEAPESFRGTLRGYQQEGLGWFQLLHELEVGGCLADDMGLGKTIQVLALLEARRTRELQNGETRRPSLAVVPKSLIFNWMDEASRFTPGLRCVNFTGQDRQQQREAFDQADLILTTYGTLRRDIVTLKDIRFDYVILDEAQAIKNSRSQAAKACLLLQSDHRLALTGTPIENHLGELWSLFEFLNPGMLGRSTSFAALCKSIRGSDQQALSSLARAIAPFILRRTKQQVLHELPAKTEQTIYCELSPKERKAYNDLRDFFRAKLSKVIDERGLRQAKIHVLEALLRLRQAACHQGLIDPNKAKDSSAKLDTLLEQLEEAVGEGHKALVFSQFTSLLTLVRDRLDKRGMTYAYLDGSTTKRKQVVQQFQEDEQCQVFLISLKAGGQGLNLTAADYVFILDPWWNPAAEMQAIDRAHRIGQSQHVFAYRIIARDTVEEKVLQLQEGKRELANAIITANDSLIRKLTAEDLKLILS